MGFESGPVIGVIENKKYDGSVYTMAHLAFYVTKADFVGWVDKIKRKYCETIENVFKGKNCSAIQVEDDEGTTNFIIHIERQISLSALPQEWLTGLSFVLVSPINRDLHFIMTSRDRSLKTITPHFYVRNGVFVSMAGAFIALANKRNSKNLWSLYT